jgi:hypothetical protein
MRYRSGEGEVSVRKFEKAMNPGLFGDQEPPAKDSIWGNQMVGTLRKEAFQSSERRPV